MRKRKRNPNPNRDGWPTRYCTVCGAEIDKTRARSNYDYKNLKACVGECYSRLISTTHCGLVDPSPAEIAERAKQIRAEWGPERWGSERVDWQIPGEQWLP